MFLAFSLLGSSGLLTNLTAASPTMVVFFRTVIAGMVFLLISALRGDYPGKQTLIRKTPQLLFSGVSVTMLWMLATLSFQHGNVGLTTILIDVFPLFLLLILLFLRIEKPAVSGFGVVALCFIGTVLCTGALNPGRAIVFDRITLILGLGAAFFDAVLLVINKNYLQEVKPFHATTIQFLIAAALVGTYMIVTDSFHLEQLAGRDYLILSTLGVVHTGLVYGLQFSAVREVSGMATSIISFVDPLVAVVLSALILGERISLLQGIGAMMIVISPILIHAFPSKQKKTAGQ